MSYLKDKILLIVDDDIGIHDILCTMLSSYGMYVLNAVNGYEAVQFIQADDTDVISIIIMDWQMPKMNGMEAYSIIRVLRPEIPIILITGHYPKGISEVNPDIVDDPYLFLLRKPMTIYELRELLDNKIARYPSGE